LPAGHCWPAGTGPTANQPDFHLLEAATSQAYAGASRPLRA
jgi:hypothetical protein